MAANKGTGQQGTYGQRGLGDLGSDHNGIWFHIRQALAEFRTAHPVIIKAFTAGQDNKRGTADVQMAVKQADGSGQSSSHDKVYSRPHGRIQGGGNAILCDPVEGDLHQGHVNDRDISAVINSGKEANPATSRRGQPSDMTVGLNIGNKAVDNWIDINGHIHMTSKTDVIIKDKAGNIVTMNDNGLFLTPAQGKKVYVTLTGTDTSSCSAVQTMDGPSDTLFAHHI